MKSKTSWSLQLIVAVILGQTLFFKFGGASESIAIYETLGAEPWGRYASGIIELIIVLLLLWPGRASLGALLGAGVMAGAIVSHLTKLGIVVADDGGLLFALAIISFVCCLGILFLHRACLPVFGKLFAPRV